MTSVNRESLQSLLNKRKVEIQNTIINPNYIFLKIFRKRKKRNNKKK